MEAALKSIENHDYKNALEILLDLNQANPREPQVNYWLGVVFLTHGQTAEAISYLQAASKVAKKEAIVFATLADALNLSNRPEDALSHARKAVALDKNSEFAHRTLGEIYARLRRPVMAEHAFKNAIRLNESSAISHLALSRLKVSLGDKKSATYHFERAFELAPDEPSVLISARDQDGSEVRKKALQRIEAVLADPNVFLSKPDRARLAFTAGKICDDAGDISKSYHYLEKHRADYYGGYDPAEQERFFETYEKVFTKAFFEERQDFALSSNKPVFVFGMPRSRTSLVEAILSAHPETSGAGELPFLEERINDLAGGSAEMESYFEAATNLDKKSAQRIGRKYLSVLDGFGRKSARVVDKLPQNFEHLWLLALLFPNAHFCHVQRNPADNCVSIYMTPLASRHTYNETQEALGHYYGQYQKLMRHWENVLPVKIRKQSYEDLVSSPDRNRRELIDHVGLRWDDACAYHEDYEGQVFTFSMAQVRKPIYPGAVNRFEKYGDHIRPLLDALANGES